MRRKQRKITDISFDVLLHVMLHLSKSLSGAKNLSRTSAVCRVLKELALDPMILEAVSFNDINISEIHKSFWKSNGFLFRCIRAGNPNAFCTAFNYVETLCASFKTIHGNFCRAAMTLRISSLEVQIVNTRARRRAYNQAFDCLSLWRRMLQEDIDILVGIDRGHNDYSCRFTSETRAKFVAAVDDLLLD